MHPVCLTPYLQRGGGPTSFQKRLAAGLAQHGIAVTYDLAARPLQAVLLVGGTRHLGGLWKARQDGIPVIQRLNGMNWIHRRRRTGIRHFLRAEYGNWLLAFIRRRIATGIVYQSQFSRSWWERARGPLAVDQRVVYNGVDLETFNPAGPHERPNDRWRILVVEGNLGGGYEWGMQAAVALAESLAAPQAKPVELLVVGGASSELQSYWQQRSRVPLQFTGWLARERIPQVDRSAHLFYAADINAACPNSVIEALACGLPVVSFDTGALPELVGQRGGQIAPYGGDPWMLAPPDVPAMAEAAAGILHDLATYQAGARRQAEEHFGLAQMTAGYMAALGI